MTLPEAKRLKWGTVLQPTKKQRDISRRMSYLLRDGIFLGMSRNGVNMVVIQQGRKTVSHWSPIFWKAKPEVKNGKW